MSNATINAVTAPQADLASVRAATALEATAARDTAVVAMLASGALGYALKDVLSALSALAIGLYVVVARPSVRTLPSWRRVALVFLGVGYAFVPGGDPVRALARFLCAVASVMLFEGRSGRERGVVFYLELAQIGMAAALLPGLSVAALLGLATLVLHRALSSAERARGASATVARGGVVLASSAAALSTRAAHRGALAVLVLGAMLFPVLPRADAPLFALRAPRERSSAGVGDSMQLQSIGELGDLELVVGRATPPEGERGDAIPYLRGAVYDHFDGRTWTSSASARVLTPDAEPATFSLVIRCAPRVP